VCLCRYQVSSLSVRRACILVACRCARIAGSRLVVAPDPVRNGPAPFVRAVTESRVPVGIDCDGLHRFEVARCRDGGAMLETWRSAPGGRPWRFPPSATFPAEYHALHIAFQVLIFTGMHVRGPKTCYPNSRFSQTTSQLIHKHKTYTIGFSVFFCIYTASFRRGPGCAARVLFFRNLACWVLVVPARQRPSPGEHNHPAPLYSSKQTSHVGCAASLDSVTSCASVEPTFVAVCAVVKHLVQQALHGDCVVPLDSPDLGLQDAPIFVREYRVGGEVNCSGVFVTTRRGAGEDAS
jgi:hypothetical protein